MEININTFFLFILIILVVFVSRCDNGTEVDTNTEQYQKLEAQADSALKSIRFKLDSVIATQESKKEQYKKEAKDRVNKIMDSLKNNTVVSKRYEGIEVKITDTNNKRDTVFVATQEAMRRITTLINERDLFKDLYEGSELIIQGYEAQVQVLEDKIMLRDSLLEVKEIQIKQLKKNNRRNIMKSAIMGAGVVAIVAILL